MARQTILIVEDESIIARDLQSTLVRAGYQVAGILDTGEDAVEFVRDHAVDLILMDIRLKGAIDGIQASNQIRRHLDVPVIYLTAFADDDTLRRAKASMPYGYITKPFDEQSLLLQIDIALYKHETEKRVREQERWLNATLTNIQDGVITINAGGTISYANATALHLLQVEKEHIRNQPVSVLLERVQKISGYSLQELHTQAAQTLRSVTTPHPLDFRYAAERLRRIEVHISPIEQNGLYGGSVFVFRDITEREIAERELKQFFDVALDFMCILASDGSFRRINASFLQCIGLSEEQATRVTLYELIHPDDVQAVRQTISGLAEGKQQLFFECRLRNACGEYRWLSWSAKAISQNQLIYATARDVTEEKRTTQLLREAEIKYRRLFDRAPVMYVITQMQDGYPIIADCNEQFLSRLGYEREDVIGKPLETFYTHESVVRLHSGGYQRALSGEFTEEERCLVTRSGEVINTVLYAIPEMDADGKVVGSLAMFVDITARKQAEAKLKRLYYHTERVREAANRLIRAKNLEEVYEIGLDAMQSIFQCDRALLMDFQHSRQSDEMRIALSRGLSEPLLQALDRLPKWRRDHQPAQAIYIEEVAKAPIKDQVKEVFRAHGIHSVALVPLVGEKLLLGKMMLLFDHPRAFQSEEKQMGQVLADHLASAIRLMESQEMLRQSEKKFRSIFENTAEGIYQSTVDGKFITVNPALVKMLGYESEEEVLNLRLPDDLYLKPEDRHRLARLVTREGRLYNVELQLKRKDGTPITVLMNDRAVKDRNGNVLYFEGTLENITERKKIEEALHMAAVGVSTVSGDQFFHTMAHYLYDAVKAQHICIARIKNFKERAFETLASVDGGRLQDNFSFRLSPGIWQELMADVDFMVLPVDEIEALPADLENRCKGCRVLLTSIKNPNGKCLGAIIAMGPSIGENEELAKSIMKIFAMRVMAELVRQIAEEERKKLEQKMQHAQKLESLGILAGGIAHDFNNLLAGILGNANLASVDLPPDSPVLEHIRQIELASKRAADLTKQLLAYSGRGKFIIEMLNLSKQVKEIAELLKVSISKKIRLIYDLQEPLPLIEADAAQIQQVIMNLLTNASEAIGDQPGEIRLSTYVCEVDEDLIQDAILNENLTPGKYVCLEVRDDGVGIPKDQLRQIFDPFYTTKFTGRGLGLAAVLGIVRGHKGAIHVISAEGKGTAFQVLFPIADQQPVSETDRPREENRWQGSGQVLVVDDEEMVRKISRKLLNRLGFDVIMAEDGREGIEVFKRHQENIRAVLLDLTMPEMSGLEVFRELKKIAPEIPVLLTSGYNEDETIQKFSGDRYAAFIQKPFTLTEIQEALFQLLKN